MWITQSPTNKANTLVWGDKSYALDLYGGMAYTLVMEWNCCEKCYREGEEVITCGCGCHVVKSNIKPDWTGDMWEYVEHNNLRTETKLEFLNKMGELGWELCLVRGGNNYIFKRKIWKKN